MALVLEAYFTLQINLTFRASMATQTRHSLTVPTQGEVLLRTPFSSIVQFCRGTVS